MEKKEMIQGLIHLKAMMLSRGINETWASKLITDVVECISNDNIVDAEGNHVTAETLANACEIVRNTTRQKIIERACEWLKKEWYSPYDSPEAREFIDSKINEFVISLEE